MRDHIYPLDVLRFLAAFSVLTFHLCFYGWAATGGATATMLNDAAHYEALAPFTWFGWVGVEVFFVISGFVIASSASGATAAAFLRGRVLRLFPAAWICATITLAAWLLVAHSSLGEMLRAYMHTISLWVIGPWVDGVYWSLSVELVFYAVVFWALVARRFVSIMALPWALTAMAVVFQTIVHTPAIMAAFQADPLLSQIIARSDILLIRYGCFFAAGIWIWAMSRNEMTPARLAGLGVAVACCLAEIVFRAREMTWGELTIVMPLPAWAPITVWLLGLGLIVATARSPHWFHVRTDRTRAVLKRIGLMTYPLFLTHNVVGSAIIRALDGVGVNQWIALPVAIVSTVALAYVICATAEVAVRNALRTAIDRGGDAIARASHLKSAES